MHVRRALLPAIGLALAITLALVPARAAPAAAAGPPLSELESQLAALIAAARGGGEYAVAVTDLQTGETIAVHGDRPHLAACSINFFVLLQVVADLEAGRYREPLVGDLVARTIYSSNPVTAYALYTIAGDGSALTGARRVAGLIARMGLDGTVLDHPPGYARVSLRPNPRDWNNWMTAADANRALAQLYRGEVVGTRWRDYLLEAMTKVKPGLNYLTAYGPEGTVSHKNGFFRATDGTWVDNDIGIVRFERDGRTYAYAISFFSQWVPTKYADIPLAQRISVATWEFFSQRYP